MVSVSEDGEHSIRSVLNWVDGSNREGWYWRADADYNTFIGVLNADTENARVAIWLDYYADGVRKNYELPQGTLAAHAASVVDIGELISSGQPDVHGQVIPAGVTFGGYHVRKVGPRLQTTLTTEALVFSRRAHSFLTFYNTCCGFQAPVQVSPNSFSGPIGFLGFMSAQLLDYCTQQWVDCTSSATLSSGDPTVATVDATGRVNGVAPGFTMANCQITYQSQTLVDQCTTRTDRASTPTTVKPTVGISGCSPLHLALGPTAPAATKTGTCNTTASPAGGSYSWTVNTNTVTLSPAGGSTDYTAANQSGSQADTLITVTYTVNGQCATAQSPGITVHKPTALLVKSDSTDPSGKSCTVHCLANPGDGTCNASTSNCNYSSYLRTRQYSVLDQFSPANEFQNVGISAATVTEELPVTTTCPDVTVATGSFNQSVFPDSFFLCSRCCLPQGPGCTAQTNPMQTIYVNGLSVRTETINWSCTGVTVNP